MHEYQIRKEKADEIYNKIKDLVDIIIVGSVGYNAVTSNSDLDLVGITDFTKVDFNELYNKLGQKYEPILVKHAKEGTINNVSIVWDEEFEIGLHLWDKTALDRVVNLEGYNDIFRRDNFDRDFKSTADVETLRNLKGEEKEIYKDPRKIEGGYVLKFYSYFQDKDIYPGIQLFNLLLDPIDLSGKYSSDLEKFQNNLRNKLKSFYGKSSPEVNLYNALAPKLKDKVSGDLKEKLIDFF